jgi:hypothetical protein
VLLKYKERFIFYPVAGAFIAKIMRLSQASHERIFLWQSDNMTCRHEQEKT